MSDDLQSSELGRETPLPQYEKTQSVPFTLNLQEDARNPGQFQLVVNICSKQQAPNGVPLNLRTSPPNDVPVAARDVLKPDLEISTLYQTQKSSPPTSPLQDKQGWADLDHVPPDFLQKVVPDWNVSFSRSDSTASTQSKRLADIKARIKKKGKGYVVRLLKGSAADSNEIAEVDLGQQQSTQEVLESHELDSASLPAELYTPPSTVQATGDSVLGRPDVYEIGTSNELGMQRQQTTPTPEPLLSSAPYMRHLRRDNLARSSIAEDGLSDAETLIPDVRSIDGCMDEDQADFESFSQNTSMYPTRSTSVSSIVKTPTRGLSVVGPVRRVEKKNRARVKSRAVNLELKRSDARKSLKLRYPRDWPSTTAAGISFPEVPTESSTLRERIRPTSRKSTEYDSTPNEYNTWQHSIRNTSTLKPRHIRHASADDLQVPSVSRVRLQLQTNIPHSKSANASPVTRRKKSPRPHRLASSSSSSSSSSVDADDADMRSSPEWAEVDHPDQLREALGRMLGSVVPSIDVEETNEERSLPRIVEPVDSGQIGEIPLPANVEIRSAPVGVRSPAFMFWGLALSALSEKAYEGFKLLRDTFGTEPPVPQGHVRVRWTCVSSIPSI
jgi:hypothetical protein